MLNSANIRAVSAMSNPRSTASCARASEYCRIELSLKNQAVLVIAGVRVALVSSPSARTSS